jgi:uncharacterized membrane protein YebE (DUF533 family)
MSLYEVLAVAALVAVGGFAYRLYRSDKKAGRETPKMSAEDQAAQSMFGRNRGTDKRP